METARINLKGNDISVFWISDVHEGNACHNESALRCAVKKILDIKTQRDDVIVIGGGDYIDAIDIGDKRFNPTEIEKRYEIRDLKDLPRKQIKRFFNNIKEIAPLFKFSLIGNHEETYIKNGHFDIYDYFCTDLLPDCKKLGFLGLLQICLEANGEKATSKNFNFSLCHGRYAGGFREGNPLNAIYDTFRFHRSDFCIAGHGHKLVKDRANYITQDRYGNKKELVCWYGMGGGFLNTLVEGQKNYFEGGKGKLSDIGFLEARLRYIGGGEFTTELIDHYCV